MNPDHLTAQFDGAPVYLYVFHTGVYEERRRSLYGHRERIAENEIYERLKNALPSLPAEIDYDYMASPHDPDLFERALALAGFVPMDDAVPEIRLPGIFSPVTDRAQIQRAIGDRKFGR